MSLKVTAFLGVCLLAALTISKAERIRYDNYHAYKVIASTKSELDFLKQLDGASDALIFLEGVNGIKRDINVVVAPHKVADFLELLANNEIEYNLLESNLQRLFEEDANGIAPSNSEYSWTKYFKLEDTYQWLISLADDYPGIVTVIEGGKTYQRRSILGVKISFSRGLVSKPGIFLEAGIHAREWIAPATATFIINKLLTSEDPEVRNIAENYDWYVFPHANPDGYVYTHTTDRTWRKTRTPYGECFGADPNRNWNFHWNEIGASNDSCSNNYAGPKAFSEIETRSLGDYIAALKGKIQLYVSFHSYSQLLLYPYGYIEGLPENHKDYEQVFDAAVAAAAKRYGTKYTGGNIYNAIYPAAGTTVDWAFGEVGIKMSFCYELRPNSGELGFVLPPEQIIPTGEEILESMIAMIAEVKKLGYFAV